MVAVIVALLSVGVGFGVGCIPFVQEHLHWNLWFVIPISGALFGAGLAWMQFMGCYVLGLRVTKGAAAILCLSAMLGYFATEVGTYLTLTVPLSGIEGVPDGEYSISSMASFSEYMSSRLGSSSFSSTRGSGSFEMGATGTTISFVADLLGAGLGACVTVVALIPQYPYCAACNRYKKRHHRYKVRPDLDEAGIALVLENVARLCQAQDHRGLVKQLAGLESQQQSKKGPFQICADERFCPQCREATILGKVFRYQGSSWDEVTELAFTTTSKVGGHGT